MRVFEHLLSVCLGVFFKLALKLGVKFNYLDGMLNFNFLNTSRFILRLLKNIISSTWVSLWDGNDTNIVFMLTIDALLPWIMLIFNLLLASFASHDFIKRWKCYLIYVFLYINVVSLLIRNQYFNFNQICCITLYLLP